MTKTADEVSKSIKEAVNGALFDKSISRSVLIEAFEDAAADLEGVLDSLKDDERRAQKS
jgi:hypothetical protein